MRGSALNADILSSSDRKRRNKIFITVKWKYEKLYTRLAVSLARTGDKLIKANPLF